MVSVYFGRLAWKDWTCNSSSDFLNLKSWTHWWIKHSIYLSYLYLTPDLSSISYIMLTRILLWVFSACPFRSTIQPSLLCYEPDFYELPHWVLLPLCGFDNVKDSPERESGRGLKLVYLLPLCLSHRIIGCYCFPLLKVTASVSQPSPCWCFHVLLTTDCWVDTGEIWEERSVLAVLVLGFSWCERFRSALGSACILENPHY